MLLFATIYIYLPEKEHLGIYPQCITYLVEIFGVFRIPTRT